MQKIFVGRILRGKTLNVQNNPFMEVLSMRKFSLFLLTLLVCLAVCAAALASAEDAVRTRYPDAQNLQLQTWGDTAAAVLTSGSTHVLCVLERDGGQWQWRVDNPTALLQDRALPDLLLDCDIALYWSYDSDDLSLSFSASRELDGWGYVAQNVQQFHQSAGLWHFTDHHLQWAVDGSLTHSWERCDENGNPLSAHQSETFAAPWLKDCIRLADFNAARFPVYTFMEYEGQWPNRAFMQEGAAYLLPGYTFVDGALADGNLEFLMDRPDGQRVFVGCSFDGLVNLCESSPMPKETGYGIENFTTSLYIGRRHIDLKKFHNHPWWGIDSLLFGGGEDLWLGMNCLSPDHQMSSYYLGWHPWNNITAVDWNHLPVTVEEAAQSLSAEGWAVVANPDPADRLHLREKPNRSSRSLGKYYNGTPVQVWEIKGDWAHVDVGGTSGWMMKKYLRLEPDGPISTGAMPRLTFEGESVELYEADSLFTFSRQVDTRFDWLVIGILEDDWYHVWFPRTGEYGYIAQHALKEIPG